MPIYESSGNSVITSTSGATKGTVSVGEGSAPVAVFNEGTPGVTLHGEADLLVTQDREATAATAGRNLTLRAGGAKLAGTNLAGGNAKIAGGISTGTGTSGVELHGCKAGASGTDDNTPEALLTVTPGSVAIDGDANTTLALERNTAAGTGKSLTINPGGAKSGETNTAGGDLILQGGLNTGSGAGGKVTIQTAPAGSTGTTDGTRATVIEADSAGNVQLGKSAPAQGATDGFVYIPVIQTGNPSGTPTAKAGFAPMGFCATTGKLCIYDGSAWKLYTPD